MELRQHRKELVARVGRLHGAVQLGFVLVGVGYWYVQIAEGAAYRELADNNRLRQLAIEAPRGLIRDRHGRSLVENVPSYDLLIDRSRVGDLDDSLRFAAGVLGSTVSELRETLDEHRRVPAFKPVPLAHDLSLWQVARIGAQHFEFPEYEIAVTHLRLYRHARHTAHVLGFLGEATEADLARPEDYRAGDSIGKSGLEARYEHRLRGARGEQVVVVDNRGQIIDEYKEGGHPAERGEDLELSLDLALQQEAARQLEGKVGAIVALDPRQGEVLAMVSSPSFDPNRFARRLHPEEWREVLGHPHHPLQNRALQNAYPPGSVFKVVMALAGLDLGVLDPEAPVFCRGASVIYGNRYRCWLASGHGRVDLRTSLKRSCNVYYHQLGQKLEIDQIAAYGRAFGLGRTTGIDLDGEKLGLMPDSRWSLEHRGEAWYPGETISVATGQGPILVTPLQVAVMMAAIANGGHLVTPHLALRIGSEPAPAAQPAARAELKLSPGHLARVRAALRSVVNEERGTGAAARLPGVEIAGKTGTAQVFTQETRTSNEDLPAELRDHAWFASYAPADDPEVVVVVFVEHGGAGSEAAAPLARGVYRTFFGGAGGRP